MNRPQTPFESDTSRHYLSVCVSVSAQRSSKQKKTNAAVGVRVFVCGCAIRRMVGENRWCRNATHCSAGPGRESVGDDAGRYGRAPNRGHGCSSCAVGERRCRSPRTFHRPGLGKGRVLGEGLEVKMISGSRFSQLGLGRLGHRHQSGLFGLLNEEVLQHKTRRVRSRAARRRTGVAVRVGWPLSKM